MKTNSPKKTYEAFNELINEVSKSPQDSWLSIFNIRIQEISLECFKEKIEKVLSIIQGMPEQHKIIAFSNLLRVLEKSEVFKDEFLELFGMIDKISNRPLAFSRLIMCIKETELFEQYYLEIEAKFIELLREIDAVSPYKVLIGSINGTKIMDLHSLKIKALGTKLGKASWKKQ